MLDQMLGSIRGYFYQQWNVKVYTKSIPESVEIPSMFFPSPNANDAAFSKASYKTIYLMNANLFAESSEEANSHAEIIAQSIRENHFSIPLLNLDGTESGGKIEFIRIETDIIDKGVAKISMEWETITNYK